MTLRAVCAVAMMLGLTAPADAACFLGLCWGGHHHQRHVRHHSRHHSRQRVVVIKKIIKKTVVVHEAPKPPSRSDKTRISPIK